MSQPRIPVELKRATKLLNHGPCTLISAAANGKANVMAAAWVMALDFAPPKIAAVLASDTYTKELVDLSGEFVVNLPPLSIADLTYTLGTTSGREIDKFTEFGVGTAPASLVGAPLIEGCIGWLECKIALEPHIRDAYDLYVAEVVAAWADPEVFDGREWRFTATKRTIHHMAMGVFYPTGDPVDPKALKS